MENDTKESLKAIAFGVVVAALLLGVALTVSPASHKAMQDETSAPRFGAPVINYQQNLLPQVTDRFDLGSSSPALEWNGLYVKNICLSGVCKVAWPTGGGGSGGGTWSTSTSQVSGQLVNYPNNTTDVVVIGATATTNAKFYIDPNINQAFFGTTTLGLNSRLQLSSGMDAQDGNNASIDLTYRNDLLKQAKANIAFHSSTSTVAWIAAHDYLDASTWHGHISIETKEASSNAVRTRLAITHSCDVCDVDITNANLNLENDKWFQVGTDALGLKLMHDTTLGRMVASTSLPFEFASTSGIRIGSRGAPASLLHVTATTDAVAAKFASLLGSANGSALLLIESGAAGGTAIQSLVTGDTVNRFSQNTSGAMQWGPGGATARDVGLSRSSANVLAVGTGASGNTGGGIIAASSTFLNLTTYSQSATSTIANALTVGGPNSYLLVATGSPSFGQITYDNIDSGGSYNGPITITAYNDSASNCAQANAIFAGNGASPIFGHYGLIGHVGQGYTGIGCPAGGPEPADSMHIFDSSGSITMNLGSTTGTSLPNFLWVTQSLGANAGERARLTSGGLFGLATTSPSHLLTIATGTKPQIGLSDGTPGSFIWTARSIANSLFFATSTQTATSTTAALSIDPNGLTTFSGATTTNFYGAGLTVCQAGNVLTYNGAGKFGCAVDATGAGGTAAYPFTVPYNSTTTIVGFNGGLTAMASSTIGNNTQAGGLMIYGGSTTTLNAYFQSPVGINGVSNRGAFGGSGIFTINGDASNGAVHEFFRPTSSGSSNIFTLTFGDTSNSVLGQINGRTDLTGSAGLLQFSTSNGSSNLERMRITSTGLIGIATTTPYWNLTVASSTGPQIALVDGLDPANSAWTIRAISNSFYLATSSALATSTAAALQITSNAGIRVPALAGCSGDIESDSTGLFACGTDAAGGGGYPFNVATPYNSTSTVVTFTSGIVASASSTIGQYAATTTLLGSIMIGNAAYSGTMLGTTTMLQVSTSTNMFAQVILSNVNGGNTASAELVLNNRLSTNSNYFDSIGINGDGYNQVLFSGERPNDLFEYSSDAGIDITLASSTASDASSSIRWMTKGNQISNLRMEMFNSGLLVMGTSTASDANFTIASSSAPQIALSDGLGGFPYTFRSIAGSFFMATSTRFATSSAVFAINAIGNPVFTLPVSELNTGTSTFASNMTIGTTTNNMPTTLGGGAALFVSNAINSLAGIVLRTWTNVVNALTVINAAGVTVFNIDTTNTTGTKFGIGSSTPQAVLTVQLKSSDTNQIAVLIASSTATATTTLFSVTSRGHFIASSTNPTVTCTGGALTSFVGDDTHGEGVCGVGATAMLVTFQVPYSVAPICTVSNQSMSITSALSYTITTTVLTISQAVGLATDKLDFICMGTAGPN